MARKTEKYELTDIIIALLLNELRREINRLDVMGFDMLNAPNITKYTKELVSRLLKSNKREYLKIAKEATDEAKEDIEALGVSATPLVINGKYVDDVLGEYNPVTNYLYYPEADRKRSRLVEALITAMVINSRADYHKELRKFANLWHTQTLQYGETMVDKTRVNTFKKNGITKIRWITQGDEKVCKECRERNGTIYAIDKIPPKPHYRCRCWYEPIVEQKKTGNNGES